MATLSEIARRNSRNLEREANAAEKLNGQITRLNVMTAVQTGVQTAHLFTARQQLAVEQEQLFVQQQQLGVQVAQLGIQRDIRQFTARNLAVSQDQLRKAIATIHRLDLANRTLGQMSASLDDVKELLSEQNALARQALDRLSNEVREHVTRGETAFANGWHEDAVGDFRKAINLDPYSPIAHYNLGRCLAAVGKADDAAASLERAIHYGAKLAPIYECRAYCELAKMAVAERAAEEARHFVNDAIGCRTVDSAAVATGSLALDALDGKVSDRTRKVIEVAFNDANVEPGDLLAQLAATVERHADKKDFNKPLRQWAERAEQAQFDRNISHFYRELDDFVYLAPRVRQAFMESAEGRFMSLASPISDLLDLTAAVGERLLKRVRLFDVDQNEIIKVMLSQRAWNYRLLRLRKLAASLARRSMLLDGNFVGHLNIGLLELPEVMEDDVVLFELETNEGDTFCLTCYYAVFIRNGVDQFTVPLHDLSRVKFESYSSPAGTKGVVAFEPSLGQTLIEGTTGSFQTQDGETIYLIDLFHDAAETLAKVHAELHWCERHADELYSAFVLLQWAADQLEMAVSSTPAARLSDAKAAEDEEFEVVPDADTSDADEFEVVE